MQCDPKLRDEMTYTSPTTGDPVGLSFIQPRTHEELVARRVMMLNWARSTCGMMGRSPDFMNVTFAAWGAAADYWGRGKAGVRHQHAALLRVHPRERPGADPLADQPATQPQRHRAVTSWKKAPRCRRCRRPAADWWCTARACWRRSGRSPMRSRCIRRGSDSIPRITVRSRSRSPFRAARRGCASCAATASITGARISTIRSGRASRRWTASCSSTTWRCRGIGCSSMAMSIC